MRGRWLPIHPSLDMSSGNQNERDKRGEMENQPAYSRMFIPYFALTRLLLPRFDYSQERIISCPRVPGDVLFRFVTESLLRQSLVFNSPVRDDGVFSHILFLGRLQLTCGVHIDLAFCLRIVWLRSMLLALLVQMGPGINRMRSMLWELQSTRV